MPDLIGSYEFERAIKALRDDHAAMRAEMIAGFAQVNRRLDVTNGQLGKHGDTLVEHGESLAATTEWRIAVDRAVFEQPKPQPQTAALSPTASKDGTETFTISMTPKMWAALVALFGGLQFVLPIVAKKLGLL